MSKIAERVDLILGPSERETPEQVPKRKARKVKVVAYLEKAGFSPEEIYFLFDLGKAKRRKLFLLQQKLAKAKGRTRGQRIDAELFSEWHDLFLCHFGISIDLT